MEILEPLQDIFQDVFDDSDLEITMETTPADIKGWDSVAQVKLVIMAESEWDFQFGTDEVAEIKSVGDFITAIKKHIDN